MLSLETDPWLEDHQIDGVAVLWSYRTGINSAALRCRAGIQILRRSNRDLSHAGQAVSRSAAADLDRAKIKMDCITVRLFSGRNLVGDHHSFLHFTAEILLSEMGGPNSFPSFWVQMQCLRRDLQTAFWTSVSGLK